MILERNETAGRKILASPHQGRIFWHQEGYAHANTNTQHKLEP